jgi:Ca2+-binding EF-hand superfamily protein
VPAPALPEPKGDVPSQEQLLARHDKNGDGVLRGRELTADAWLAAARAWADEDGDGALSLQELRKLVEAVAQRRAEAMYDQMRPTPYEVPFDAWDTDRDGRIRTNEWQAGRSLFDLIDLDRDAAIARDEVQRYRRRVTGKDFVDRFDDDGDGKVTLAEFGGPPGAFARADRSGDGTVTRGDG